jgi:hypothetical protein
MFVAVFSLSSCCYIIFIPVICASKTLSTTGHPKPGQSEESAQAARAKEDPRVAKSVERVADRVFARRMGVEAGSASSQTLAPFYGNLSVVSTTTADSLMLVRQSDCSLTLGEFNLDYSNGTSTVTVTSTTPNYEKTIHDNAFLSTTPDAYPNGCASSAAGAASALYAYLGQEKNNGPYVAATTNGDSILTSAIGSSYVVTPGAMLTPDIPPFSITAADLNKDGNLDLISINTDGLNGSVTVYLNNGDGTFKPGVNYDMPSDVMSFGAAGDLDGDGNTDVLVNVQNGGFMVLSGKGDGTLKAPVSVATGGQTTFFAEKFILADVNGDKKLDIITAQGQVFLNSGDGVNFTYPGPAFPAVANPSNGLAPGLVVLDFDKDGKMDLAVDDGNSIRIYLGNGTGVFTTGPAYATISNRGLITGTDIDGDGNLDVWAGSGGDAAYTGDDYLMNQAYALMGNGDGTFAGAPSLPVKYTGTNLVDLNGDGRPDLVGYVFNATTSEFDTYLTNASGVPAFSSSLPAAAGVQVDSYAVGAFDTNSSTHAGLIYLSAAPQTQSFYLALGTGDGKFSAPTQIPVPSLVPAPGFDINENITGLHAADFNHDGKLDIVYSFEDQSSIGSQLYYEGFAVQLGNGDGTFAAPQIVYTYQNQNAPAQAFSNILSFVSDVNKDNFADVFLIVPPITVGNAPTVELFVGNGDGTFKAPNTLNVTPTVFPPVNDGSYGTPFALADLNGDGKLDLVTGGSSADSSTPEIAITLGNGDGTFQPPTILKLGGFGFAGSPALADFDGDGKIDLYMGGVIEGANLGVFPGKGDGTFNTIANADGTVSAPDAVLLSAGGGAVGVDLNNDKLPDLIVGGVILINKSSVTPPTQAATSTIVSANPNPSNVGADVLLTATISSTTAGTITGTVTFFDGSTQIGTGSVSMSGQVGVATFTTSTLSEGSHAITAQYGGDANYSTSTSPAYTQSVTNGGALAVTTTTATSSLNPSIVGANVTFTATVVPTAPSASKPSGALVTAATPTGTVTFKDGSTTLGTGTLTSGATTFSTAALTQGSHTISAVYGGDTNYATSTGTVTQVVNAATSKAATTTALVSSLNPSTTGTNVVFTATVTSTTAGTITGTVSFLDGGTVIRNATIGTGGRATFQTTALTQGTHAITAQYLGDSTGYATSTSPAVSQVVNAAAGKAATSTALSASSTNAVAGTNITFTATVTSTTAGTISGSVAFLDGGTQIGTGTMGAGGVTTYSNNTLTAGSHTITASYGGDTNYATSTSPSVGVTITAAGGSFTVAASPSSVTVSPSTPATTQITVSPSGAFSAPVSFSCAATTSFGCTFSPTSVTPSGGAASTMLTITYNPTAQAAPARRTSSVLLSPNGGGSSNTGTGGAQSAATAVALAHPFGFSFACGGELLALALLSISRRKNAPRAIAAHTRLAYAVVVCALAVTVMAGCSGNGSSPQSTTISVNATSGITVVSTPISVNFTK